MNQAVTFLGQAELLEEPFADSRLLPVERRRPELDRLLHLDSLLQLRRTGGWTPMRSCSSYTSRTAIEAEHRDRAAVGRADTLDTFHRRALPGTVRSDEAEDLAITNFKRDVVDGHGLPIAFSDRGNLDDRACGALSAHESPPTLTSPRSAPSTGTFPTPSRVSRDGHPCRRSRW